MGVTLRPLCKQCKGVFRYTVKYSHSVNMSFLLNPNNWPYRIKFAIDAVTDSWRSGAHCPALGETLYCRERRMVRWKSLSRKYYYYYYYYFYYYFLGSRNNKIYITNYLYSFPLINFSVQKIPVCTVFFFISKCL